jgi:hypothetical protein
MDGGAYPAPFPAPPQVVSGGGSILQHPKIHAFMFANDNDPNLPYATVQQFYAGIGASTYWQGLAEYGVQAATATVTRRNESAPSSLDDLDIRQWLRDALDAGTVPPSDPNTVYALHYPSGTSITFGPMQSCVGFGGYHSSVRIGTENVAYAVLPRCATFLFPDPVDNFAAAASHELVEAAADPAPEGPVTFGRLDDDHAFLQLFTGGEEIADLCAQNGDGYNKFSDFPFTVARYWSNSGALAGRDPCAPEIPGTVYFAAAPVLSDHTSLMVLDRVANVLSVHIPVGGSATIPVQLYSEGPVSDWVVEAIDGSAMLGSQSHLNLGLSSRMGNNGSTVQLTIMVVSAGAQNVESFELLSKIPTAPGQPAHYTYGLVSN